MALFVVGGEEGIGETGEVRRGGQGRFPMKAHHPKAGYNSSTSTRKTSPELTLEGRGKKPDLFL